MQINGERVHRNGDGEKAAWCKYFLQAFQDFSESPQEFESKQNFEINFSFDGTNWSRLKDGAGTEFEQNGLYNYRGYPFAMGPRIFPELYEVDSSPDRITTGEGQWRQRARFPFVEYSDGLRHFQ